MKKDCFTALSYPLNKTSVEANWQWQVPNALALMRLDNLIEVIGNCYYIQYCTVKKNPLSYAHCSRHLSFIAAKEGFYLLM